MKTDTRWLDLKYGATVGAIVVALIGVLQLPAIFPTTPVGFCRKAFESLARGRMGAVGMVDWEQLTAMGINVGTTYRSMAGDRNRASYQRQFIESFARGFRTSGGQMDAFVHWRVAGQQAGQTIVAVDYPAKQRTLLFAVPSDGPRRVVAIQWAS